MKKIFRHPVGVGTQMEEYEISARNTPHEIFEVPHDSEILYQVAARAINERLRYSEESVPWSIESRGRITVSLNPSNPNHASLYSTFAISPLEFLSAHSGDKIRVELIRKAVNQLLAEALQRSNTVHRLRKSFIARLKYLFNQTP